MRSGCKALLLGVCGKAHPTNLWRTGEAFVLLQPQLSLPKQGIINSPSLSGCLWMTWMEATHGCFHSFNVMDVLSHKRARPIHSPTLLHKWVESLFHEWTEMTPPEHIKQDWGLKNKLYSRLVDPHMHWLFEKTKIAPNRPLHPLLLLDMIYVSVLKPNDFINWWMEHDTVKQFKL